jgi:two-component system nitrogen regulation sensor histidine kinase NtrY
MPPEDERSPSQPEERPAFQPAEPPVRPPGEGVPSPDLPVAEQRRRRREIWISGVVLAAIAGLIVVRSGLGGPAGSLPTSSSLLFLLLNAVNVILVVLLVYLIARSFVKLFFERRKGILGSHLHLKFVSALFLVATIPTTIVFLVSYTFVSASIETWFSLQVDGALDRSREVADSYYDAWARSALHYGDQLSGQIRDRRLLREENREALEAFVQEKQREYDLGVVQVFPYAESAPLVTSVNPEIPDAAFVQRESPIVAAAFAGESATLVEGTGSEVGDVIRGAVPIRSADPARASEVVGALVVNYMVPHALAAKVAEIRSAFDQYRAVQPYAGHIAWVYQIELLLFSLVILLFALWWGFRMAKGVTHSISALAEGTAEVARGNLDVEVEPTSDDEVGFLVRSFNRMTQDLREAHTGLEHTNAELEQRRRYIEIVLRNVDAGVVSFDAAGCISTINPSAQRFLGIPAGTPAVGHKLEEVTGRSEYLDVIAELQNQTRAGIRESVRKQVQITSGDDVLTLVVTLTLLQDDDGRPLGVVVVFDDYTQEVRAQRMAAWREVARRIAHEIKNPLTPIQLSAQRIRRRLQGRLGDAQDAKLLEECVDTITHQVDGLKILVNEFSNFARLPAARPKPGNLNRMVEEAIASYAGTEGVGFHTELDAGLPTVDFDVDQMRRVLTNLIDNAIAAIGEAGAGGQVEVRTVWDAPLQTARIEIADEGTGIRSEDRRRIFEPYYSTKTHGTGLGLAIVSRIVADHHGYIRVHENRPRGTRFIVELPARVG